jgi:chorismate mutase
MRTVAIFLLLVVLGYQCLVITALVGWSHVQRQDTSIEGNSAIGFTNAETLLPGEKLDIAVEIAAALLASTFTPEPVKYVSRPALEKKISTALTHNDYMSKSLVVYGPRRTGKSTVVDQFFANQTGVIKLTVSTANTMKDVVVALAEVIFQQGNSINMDAKDVNGVTLVSTLKLGELFPTFIFEVSCDTANSPLRCVQAVRNLVKLLSLVARCIVVLTQPAHMIQFVRSGNAVPERFTVVYVDAFEKREAKQFLNNVLSLNLTREVKEFVYENVGTSAGILQDLKGYFVKEINSYNDIEQVVEAFVHSKLQEAKQDLVRFPYQVILELMVATVDGSVPLNSIREFNDRRQPSSGSSHSRHGIEDRVKDRQERGYGNPFLIASVLESPTCPLLCRCDNDSYDLVSRAHYVALKNMFMPA